MRNNEGYTPKEYAISLIYDQMYYVLRERSRRTHKFDKETNRHIRQILYKLVEKTKLEVTPLPEDVNE